MTIFQFLKTKEARNNLKHFEIRLIKKYYQRIELDYTLCDSECIGININENLFHNNRKQWDLLENNTSFNNLLRKLNKLVGVEPIEFEI